jgi:two-component system, chemotaxis family, protein-glutamate methylesterase/glutaminase
VKMTYKVIIVDDSAFMRRELKKILNQDSQLNVIATAENGEVALNRIKELQPDVVTMDINMPVMDGITALEHIMRDSPCSVVMVSALTHEAAEETVKALTLGAFDFFHKPSGSISLDISAQSEIIRNKVLTAAKNKNRNISRRNPWSRFNKKFSAVSKIKQAIKLPRWSRIAKQGDIAAIGVSTGGPRTLLSILPEIPANFAGSIVIAQHMPEKFTLSFANRLDDICPLKVKEAKDGEILQVGRIYIAPGGRHIRIKRKESRYFVIEVIKDRRPEIFIPSADLLFRSLLHCSGRQWLGIMLTGMGADGALALSEHRKLGGHTIAESEESCVVFGMPRRVIEMNGAEFILNEDQIAGKIVELIGTTNGIGNK